MKREQGNAQDFEQIQWAAKTFPAGSAAGNSIQTRLVNDNDHCPSTSTLSGAQHPMNPTGYAGTVYRNIVKKKPLISFRYSEFIKGVLANDVGASDVATSQVWRVGQIAAMEARWASSNGMIPAGSSVPRFVYIRSAHQSSTFVQQGGEAGELTQMTSSHALDATGTGGIQAGSAPETAGLVNPLDMRSTAEDYNWLPAKVTNEGGASVGLANSDSKVISSSGEITPGDMSKNLPLTAQTPAEQFREPDQYLASSTGIRSELSIWLEYSKLQLASEAFLDRYLSGSMTYTQALTFGNDHSSKFTPTEAADFANRYEVVAHQPNMGTGFSGTLFWDTVKQEYILSFRSTEFVEDVLCDSVGTNEGIADYGWAFGQIADMEDWWAQLNQEIPGLAGQQVTVTGYSLGGHLATAFAQLRAEAGELSRIAHIYTFNGAGTGGIQTGHTLTEVMALFMTVRDTGILPDWLNSNSTLSQYVRDQAQVNLDDILDEMNTIKGYTSGLNDGSEPLEPNPGDFANYNLHLAMAVAGYWTTGATLNTDLTAIYDSANADTGGMMFEGLMTELLGSGISAVAVGGLRHTYSRTEIKIEDQPLLRGTPTRALTGPLRLTDEYALNDFADTHSLVLIIDSLAVLDVIAQLDQNPARIDNDFATALIEAASGRVQSTLLTDQGKAEGDPLEVLVDALHRLFIGTDSELRNNPLILEGGHWADTDLRNSFYAALDDITNSVLYQQSIGLLNVVSLVGLDASSVANLAMQDTADGLAYRYALEQLNPFVLTGDSGIYEQHNSDGHLDADQFSELYLQDRAAMLSWLLSDITPVDTPYGETYFKLGNFGDRYYYQDLDSNTQIRLGETVDLQDPPSNFRHILFGSDRGDILTATTKADHLYGMGGDDTLTGGQGSDHLEGGAGSDTYQFAPGDGYDTVLDSDGLGVIQFGTINAQGCTGLDLTKWCQLSDTTWADTQNNITYMLSSVDGETQLLINRGDNNILVKGWAEGELGIALGAGTPPVVNESFTGTANADWQVEAEGGGGGYASDGQTGHAVPGFIKRFDGLDGDDLILPGIMDNEVYAGAGNDTVLSRYGGSDVLFGEAGHDFIHVGDSDPENDGEAFFNTLARTDNHSIVDGGEGDDTITATRYYSLDRIAVATNTAHGFLPSELGTAFSGRTRAQGTFYMTSDAPEFTFTGWSRDGVNMAQDAEGQLNLYATFQYPVAEFTAPDPVTGIDTLFKPVMIYNAALDNDDTAGHTLLGGTGNDMVEGGLGADFIDGGADNDALDGERGVDTLFGGSGEDLILGGEDNDWMDGGSEADTLMGEAGDDTLYGDSGDDVLYGDSAYATTYLGGNDTLNGGAGKDTLFGGGGDDTLYGGDGNDHLDGGAGADIMAGGLGDDAYLIDDLAGDVVIEAAGEGNDAIYFESPVASNASSQSARMVALDAAAPISITLQDNFEYLFLSGDADIDGIGNDTDNILSGSGGANTLTGGQGNDTLTGNGGDDVYVFNRGDGQDAIDNIDFLYDINNLARPQASDTLSFGAGIAESDVLGFKSGENLVLQLKGTTDQVAIIDYYGAEMIEGGTVYDRKIDQVEFDNGTVWDQAMIQTVVDRATNNHAPTVGAYLPTLKATAGTAYSYTIPNGTITDPDAWDSITYKAVMSDGSALPDWLSFDATTLTLSGTPDTAQVGSLQFVLWGTDNYGASTGFYVTMNIALPNNAPVLSVALPDQAVVQGTAFSYTVASNAFTDPDAGDTLSYSATLADGSALPSWAARRRRVKNVTLCRRLRSAKEQHNFNLREISPIKHAA